MRTWGLVLLILLLGACERKTSQLFAANNDSNARSIAKSKSGAHKERGMQLSDGLYARITSGDKSFLVELYYRQTPLTVTSFVGLAEGKLKNTAQKAGKPYFNGLTWHRIVPGFVIQGGDPLGNGTGGPGYNFPDEFSPELKHDAAGVLSMANAGPGTNGSQFFITLGPQPHLDGRHSVFGRVIQGAELLEQVKQGDSINSIVIERVGKEARAFNSDQQAFDTLMAAAKGRETQVADQQWQASLTYARNKWSSSKEVQDDAGIIYWITQAGNGGDRPKKSSTVTAHYRLTVVDQKGTGQVIDESYRSNTPFTQPLANLIPGWSVMLTQMQRKEKRSMVIPAQLGYGTRGAPPAIPPNSALVFEVELLDFS